MPKRRKVFHTAVMHAYLYPGVVLDPSALTSNYSSLKLVCICGTYVFIYSKDPLKSRF